MTAREVAERLSLNARRTINDGDDHEWYALTERAADDLARAGLVRRPFSNDRKVCVPNTLGLAVRAELIAMAGEANHA